MADADGFVRVETLDIFLDMLDESELFAFFTSNTFISNAKLKLAINQAKPKQHPEAEF